MASKIDAIRMMFMIKWGGYFFLPNIVNELRFLPFTRTVLIECCRISGWSTSDL